MLSWIYHVLKVGVTSYVQTVVSGLMLFPPFHNVTFRIY